MTFPTSLPYELFAPDAPDGVSSGFSAHYYWMFTIRPAECRLFNAVFDRVGSSEQAIGFLAGRYPFGLPPESSGVLTDEDIALLVQVSVRKISVDSSSPDVTSRPDMVAPKSSSSLPPAVVSGGMLHLSRETLQA